MLKIGRMAASAVPTIAQAFPTAEIMRSPFDFYAEVRELGPVVRIEDQDEYVVTRYDAIRDVARRPDLFSSSASITERTGLIRRATRADLSQDRAVPLVTADRP